MAKNEILFSTKDKYDYPYWKSLLWTIIPGIAIECTVWFVFRGEIMLLTGMFLGIFLGKELTDPLLMKKSYVDLYGTYMKGVSMKKLGGEGETFRLTYKDIIRVDSRQDRIIVRTADAKYQVQAYGCEHEVKAMICRRMSGQRNKG